MKPLPRTGVGRLPHFRLGGGFDSNYWPVTLHSIFKLGLATVDFSATNHGVLASVAYWPDN